MNSTFVELIGLTAGVLGIIAWIPQIREVWVQKKHEGISLPTFSLVTFAISLWLIYGLLTGSPSLIFANVLTLIVLLLVIGGVLRCRREESQGALKN